MTTYTTIHTAVGLERMAQAEASGTPIILTHVVIGDGAGHPVLPEMQQLTLVRERYRTTIGNTYRSDEQPNRFSVEATVPADVGGFTMREIGVLDIDGNLIVVGNLPNTYKPTPADGAYSDTLVRVDFLMSNSETCVIEVDPNVTVVSQTWIENNVNAGFVLPGGTTGQTLRKRSNTDGDTEWGDPGQVNVTVGMLEEVQTLASGQTAVDWATLTNTGLAVYVNGSRLRGDEWTPAAGVNTRITLAASYPVGTRIVGVQNEPAGTMPDVLVRPQNLADVPDKSAARNNLGVYSRAETDQRAPAGLVAFFARSSAPAGWLKCNGAAISRTAYATLFAAIGTTFGAGNGFDTFNLPDLRGEFVRGLDDGRGVDGGRSLGSWQAQQVQAHKHISAMGEAFPNSHLFGRSSATGYAGTHGGVDGDNYLYYTNDGTPYASGTPNATGVVGAETRPRNHALLACIKY